MSKTFHLILTAFLHQIGTFEDFEVQIPPELQLHRMFSNVISKDDVMNGSGSMYFAEILHGKLFPSNLTALAQGCKIFHHPHVFFKKKSNRVKQTTGFFRTRITEGEFLGSATFLCFLPFFAG